MENKVAIGSLIGYLRTEANISQEELCRGLCSRPFLARLEKGERDCEKIVAEALLQRLGMAADRIDFIAGPEEQQWILLREALYRSIEETDENGAAEAFEEYESYAAGKSPLHRQLLLYYRAVLNWKLGATVEELHKLLSEYKGMYCIESFNPLGVFWYRRHRKEIVRGQLSDAFLREGEYRGVLYFLLQNLVFNFLTKPDFIAYHHKYPELLSRRICRGLYHNTAAAWTIKSQKELDAARKNFDIFIFDSFMPER